MWAKLLRVFQTRPTSRRKRAANQFRPVLYDLETRLVPATLVWKGPPIQGDFNDPVNWINVQTKQHAVPGPRDDAFINGAQEVVVTAPTTINSLVFPDGALDVIAGVAVANFQQATQIGSLHLLQDQSAFVADNATRDTAIGNLLVAPGAEFVTTDGTTYIINGSDIWGNVTIGTGAEVELVNGLHTVYAGAGLSDPSGVHDNTGQLKIDVGAQFNPDTSVPLNQIILVDKAAPQASYIEWGSDWQYSPRDGKWHRSGIQYGPDGQQTGTVDESKLIVNEANGNTRTTTVRKVTDNNGNVKKTKRVRVDKPGPPRSIEAKYYEWQNGQWVQTGYAYIEVVCA